MNASLVCPMICSLDRKVSNLLGNKRLYTPEQVARLRALYESERPNTKLDFTDDSSENVELVAGVLERYKQRLFKHDYLSITGKILTFYSADKKLNRAYENESETIALSYSPNQLKLNRAKAIANIVSGVADELCAQFPKTPREEIFRGISTSKGTIGGMIYLLAAAKDKVQDEYCKTFERVRSIIDNSELKGSVDFNDLYHLDINSIKINYDDKDFIKNNTNLIADKDKDGNIKVDKENKPTILEERLIRAVDEANVSINNSIIRLIKYQRMLENWDTLALYAQKEINDREGIKSRFKLMMRINPIDSDVDADFDSVEYNPEEEVHDSYNNEKAKNEPLSTMTAQVRRMCYNVPVTRTLVSKKTKYTYDEFGERTSYTVYDGEKQEFVYDDMGYKTYYHANQVFDIIRKMFSSKPLNAMEVEEVFQRNKIIDFSIEDLMSSESTKFNATKSSEELHTKNKNKNPVISYLAKSIDKLPIADRSAAYGTLYRALCHSYEHTEMFDLDRGIRTNPNSNFKNLYKQWLSSITNNFRGMASTCFFKSHITSNVNGRKYLSKRGVFDGDKLQQAFNLYKKISSTKNYFTSDKITIDTKVRDLINLYEMFGGYVDIEEGLTPDLASLLINTVEGRGVIRRLLKEYNKLIDAYITYLGSKFRNAGIENYFNVKNEGGNISIDKNKFTIKSTKENYKVASQEGYTGEVLTTYSYDEFNQFCREHNVSITDIIDKASTKDTDNKAAKVIRDCYGHIETLIEEFDPTTRSTWYRYIDKNGKKVKYYNLVAPSKAYEIIEQMHYFMGAKDAVGYAQWLEDNYLSNPLICTKKMGTDGKEHLEFYNDIIEKLYNTVYTNEGVLSEDRFKNLVEDSESFINNFQVGKVLGLVDTKFSDCTDKEHTEIIYHDFFADNTDNKYCHIPMFILGDSNAYKYMVGTRVKGIKSSDIIKNGVERLYKTFLSEVKRWDLVDNTIAKYGIEFFYEEGADGGFKHPNNAIKFCDLPFLDAKFTKDKNPYAPTVDGSPITYYNRNSIYTDSSHTEIREDVANEVKAKIEKYLKDRLNYYIDDLVDKGLLERIKTKDNKIEYRPIGNFRTILSNTIARDNTSISTTQIINYITSAYVNTKCNLVDQIGMFDGSTSFYQDIKIFQKRNKQLHASGFGLDVDALDMATNERILPADDVTEHCIYIKDPKHNPLNYQTADGKESSPLMQAVDKIYKDGLISKTKYEKILDDLRKSTVTDGEAWRTLKSYRKLMHMSHQWTEELEDKYNRITKLQERIAKDHLTGDELKNAKDAIYNLAVSFKPIKPFAYGFETIDNGVKVPVQHKYAETVIIPELLPEGNKLKDMAEWADANGIDLILSEECVKVGKFKVIDIREKDDEGKDNVTDIESLYRKLGGVRKDGTAIKGDDGKDILIPYVHKMDYRDYRIQTNVPDHMYEATLEGTQARKIWYNDIDRSGNHSYLNYVSSLGSTVKLVDGTNIVFDKDGNGNNLSVSGDDIIKFYTQLHCANILESLSNIKATLSDKKRVAEILLDGILSNDRQTIDALENYSLTKEEEFLIPLFAPTMSRENQGVILSLFKKAVNKQKMAGGSAVQVSPMGICKYDDAGDLRFMGDPNNASNILYGECEMAFDMKVFLHNGREYRLKFSDYCFEDGTLIPERECTEEEIQSGLYQSYINDKGKQYVPKLEVDYPGSLDIVAKRIPTERGYSMLRLRVKRFSPMASGPTVKVPAEGTTLAGFDYDIDKLYLIRKEFRVKNYGKNSEMNQRIWHDFYKDHPDYKEALLEAWQKAETKKSKEECEKELNESLDNAVEDMVNNTEDTEDDDVAFESKNKLYRYWFQADLPGTYQDALGEYIDQNVFKYYNIKNDSFEKYDGNYAPNDSKHGNTTVARNNMIFELYLRRLEDPETLASRITPGGFASAINAAKACRELIYGKGVDFDEKEFTSFSQLENVVISKKWTDPEPNRDPSEISTIVYFNKQNQIAGKEIGVFANHNVTHAYLTTFKECRLAIPIKLGSHAFDGGLSDLIQADDIKKRYYSELMIAELLASSVDAVKQPVLNYMNLNTYTANVAAMMARLGYSMMDIGIFLNQPIIREFVKKCDYSGASQDVILTKMLDSLISKDSENIKADFFNNDYSDVLNEHALISGIRMMDPYKNKYQSAIVLQLFNLMRSQASSLSDITTATKMSASNSVGSTVAFFADQTMNIDDVNKVFSSKNPDIIINRGPESGTNLLNNELNVFDDNYLATIGNTTSALEQCFYDANKGITKLMEAYFPYTKEDSGYSKSAKFLKEASFTGKINENILNYMYEDWLTYLLTLEEGSSFNPNTEVETLRVNGKYSEEDSEPIMAKAGEYYLNDFVKEYINFRNSWTEKEWKIICKTYPILDLLTTSASVLSSDETLEGMNTDKLADHCRIYIGRMTHREADSKQLIKSSWEAMFQPYHSLLFTDKDGNKDERQHTLEYVLPRIASGLFYYSHFLSGNTYSPASFIYEATPRVVSMIRTCDIQKGEKYINFLKKIFNGEYGNSDTVNIIKFINMFIRNHSDFYQFVRNVSDYTLEHQDSYKSIKELIYPDGTHAVDSFVISKQTLDDGESGGSSILFKYMGKSEDGESELVKYYPAIKVKGNLYIANPTIGDKGNISYTVTSDTPVVYTKYSELGATDKTSMYWEPATRVRVEIADNIAPSVSKPSEYDDILDAVRKYNPSGVDADASTVIKQITADMYKAITKRNPEGYSRAEKIPTGEEQSTADVFRDTISRQIAASLEETREVSDFGKDLIEALSRDNQAMLRNIVDQFDSYVKTLDENGNETNICG